MAYKVVTLPRVIKVCILLIMVFLAVMVVSMLVGTAKIGIITGLKGLLYGWHEDYSGLTSSEKTIIFSIRFPRIIFAGIVGASLSTAGVVFQALLRNPLADPYILGISGGSAVGAITGIIIGASVVPLNKKDTLSCIIACYRSSGVGQRNHRFCWFNYSPYHEDVAGFRSPAFAAGLFPFRCIISRCS